MLTHLTSYFSFRMKRLLALQQGLRKGMILSQMLVIISGCNSITQRLSRLRVVIPFAIVPSPKLLKMSRYKMTNYGVLLTYSTQLCSLD